MFLRVSTGKGKVLIETSYADKAHATFYIIQKISARSLATLDVPTEPID